MRLGTESRGFARGPGLRRRLILALAIPGLVVLLASSYLDLRTAQRTAERTHDHELADTLYDLQGHVERRDRDGAPQLARDVEAALRSDAPDVLYLSVRDDRGALLLGDPDLPPATRASIPGRIEFHDARYRGQAVRVASLHLSPADGGLWITVAETVLKRTESRRHIFAAMLFGTVATMIASLLVVLLGVWHGLRPLQSIEREIARRSIRDLQEIDLERAPIELRPMLARLNELFALLRKFLPTQQRFIADAAHQLRTPLSAMRNQIDLAAKEGVFAAHREYHERLDEACSRLGHLLNQMLAYARTESLETAIYAIEVVAVQEMIEDLATEFLDASLARDIDLGFDIEPVRILGVPSMLKEALANLIDNAIRYTPRDGVINVRCRREGDAAVIEIEDSGPGIPAAQRPLVFERFYRVPGAPAGGCGLGLPIVREIVRLHDGTVELLDGEGGGLCVRLRFPATRVASGEEPMAARSTAAEPPGGGDPRR